MPKKISPEQLTAMRHTAAHLLAAAVKDLWPGTHNAIGPAIENGFYQDFDFGEHKISEQDFPRIEKRMRQLVKKWGAFKERAVSADEARQLFADNPYKLELIKDFASDEKNITVNDPGNFLDLCRGGHFDGANKKLQYFKLLSLAGAYWRGDEQNKMLTRIYGTAFFNQAELDEHLKMLEEAKKRDHKVLGPQLGLFAFSPLVGQGLPLFLPKGEMVYHELEKFIRQEKEKRGYKFVRIPHIAKAALYEKSGHLGKYDAMMPTMVDQDGDSFVIKPMNCPHHFEIYKAQPHSYKDLPLRLAGTTAVYRNEKSGELSGLVRVKSLTQDDTHHFVRRDQIESEIAMILGLMDTVYQTFNFADYRVQISIRDPKQPEKYFGDNTLWNESEKILIEAVKRWGRPYEITEGEAAFYGPKIDIMVKDSLGREWQLTTLQLDFNQPENFQMRYIGEDGKEHAPAVLHVAILGAVERFFGILIEHYAGAMPLWLAPIQALVLPIADAQHNYAKQLTETLLSIGIRVEIDDRSESIGKKIREGQLQKVPYMLIIGKKEIAENVVAVRSREQGDEGTKSLDALKEALLEKIKAKE